MIYQGGGGFLPNAVAAPRPVEKPNLGHVWLAPRMVEHRHSIGQS